MGARRREMLLAAFNPLTFSITVAVAAVIAALLHHEVPRPGRCLRKRPGREATR